MVLQMYGVCSLGRRGQRSCVVLDAQLCKSPLNVVNKDESHSGQICIMLQEEIVRNEKALFRENESIDDLIERNKMTAMNIRAKMTFSIMASSKVKDTIVCLTYEQPGIISKNIHFRSRSRSSRISPTLIPKLATVPIHNPQHPHGSWDINELSLRQRYQTINGPRDVSIASHDCRSDNVLISDEGTHSIAAQGKMENIPWILDHRDYILDDSTAEVVKGDLEVTWGLPALFGRSRMRLGDRYLTCFLPLLVVGLFFGNCIAVPFSLVSLRPAFAINHLTAQGMKGILSSC